MQRVVAIVVLLLLPSYSQDEEAAPEDLAAFLPLLIDEVAAYDSPLERLLISKVLRIPHFLIQVSEAM